MNDMVLSIVLSFTGLAITLGLIGIQVEIRRFQETVSHYLYREKENTNE